jgi:hypothetical protein
LRLCGVHDRVEEDWISFRVDYSLVFVELDACTQNSG